MSMRSIFVIHAGDLTHEGDKASFDFVRSSFSRLKAPLWFTLGNRDGGEPGIRSWLAAEWGLQSQTMYYARHHNGVRYIFLDSNYAHLPTGQESEIQRWDQTSSYTGVGFSAAQLDWLTKELESDRETLTFVIELLRYLLACQECLLQCTYCSLPRIAACMSLAHARTIPH